MKVYEVHMDSESKPVFVGTFDLAKKVVKDGQAGPEATFYRDIKVFECEVQTDKEGIIHALNRLPIIERSRSWRVTSRGGLKEGDS